MLYAKKSQQTIDQDKSKGVVEANTGWSCPSEMKWFRKHEGDRHSTMLYAQKQMLFREIIVYK